MIVFTAKHNSSDEIFVGSTRDSMEEQWARLIVQAEEGAQGELFAAIREHSGEAFALEVYDYAETPSEARQLVREASETLGGSVIKTGKAVKSPKPAQTSKAINKETINQTQVQTKTAEELKRDIEAFLATKKPSLEGKETQSETRVSAQPDNSLTKDRQPVTSQRNQQPSRVVSRQQQKEHGPVTQVDIAAYLADKDSTNKPKEAVALRQTASTQEVEDMKAVMMRIELKRRQNRASNQSSKSSRKINTQPTSKSTNNVTTLSTGGGATKTVTTKPSKDKLPDGRVSSSAKEKRIKEAIAQERMAREAAQAAKVAAEAKEMAEIMAKLDRKTKEKESLRRRR